MKNVITMCVLFAVCSAQAVKFERVLVRQQWPWGAKVNIDYVLADAEGKSWDVEVVLRAGGETLSVPKSSFSGDRYGVSAGAHRIVWDPSKTDYASRDTLGDVTVTLSAKDVEDSRYLIIDMSHGAQNWARPAIWPVSYTNEIVDSDGDGRWDREFKLTKMAFRRIDPGSFIMGAPSSEIRTYSYTAAEYQHEVTITEPFYMAVFELTSQQFYQIWAWRINNTYGKSESTGARPANNLSYDYIRGSAANGIDWPTTGTKVYDVESVETFVNINGYTANTISTLGWFRRHVPGLLVDLPTEAQWEYCCRAGTSTPFNNGTTLTNANAVCDGLSAVGRYKFNSFAYDSSTGSWTDPKDDSQLVYGTAEVGSLAPNAWGLYDMHGNEAEWVRDWMCDKTTAPETDPQGSATGTKRCFRGGCWSWGPSECRSASVSGDAPNKAYSTIGCRFMIPMP